MRRLALSMALAMVAALALAGAALAQPAPEFRLGFKALADQIPNVAGQALEEEHYGPNGDSLQQTTTGLMVWRKADNWTAFTNGSWTWVNGPAGVQDRPNEVRFVWEMENPAPSPQNSSYGPVVKAMDLAAGGPGGVVQRLMGELDSDWAQTWGWRSSKPLTIYLFIDGYQMVNGIPAITGWNQSPDQRQYYRDSVMAFNTGDAQTGGYAIVMNLSNGIGTPNWEYIMKGTLARQYAYVMQKDAAGNAGAAWFTEGLPRVAAEAKVPLDPTLKNELNYLYELKRRGTQPTLRKLQQDWPSFVGIAYNYQMAGNSFAFMAVRVVADRVGYAPLLEIERRVARGEDFESALRAVSGLSIEAIDQELQNRLK